MSRPTVVRGIRLSHPDLGDLDVVPSAGIQASDLEVGFPQPREAVFDRSGVDGEDDETRFHGGAVVSLSARLRSAGGLTAAQWLDRLMPYLAPQVRSTLSYRFDGEGWREIVVRGQQAARPVAGRDPFGVRVDVQWRAPEGVSYSAGDNVVLINPGAEEDGRTYDLTFDRSYPESGGRGSIDVTNQGTTRAYPTFRVFGPCTDPTLTNERQGRELVLETSVAAGDYVEVDTMARTIRLNGLPQSNLFDALDFPASEWFSLDVGVSRLRYVPASFSSPSVCEIRWRDTYI